MLHGKSGSGKSSIVEALIWCLYGKGRADNRSLVNKDAEECQVSVSFEDGDKTVGITRRLGKGGKQSLSVEIFENGEYKTLTTSGIAETQEWITDKFLKCSYALFVNSVAYPQENPESFLKLPASRRKDLLLEMAKSMEIDAYRKLTTDKIFEFDTNRQEMEKKVQYLTGAISALGLNSKDEAEEDVRLLEEKKLNLFASTETIEDEKEDIAIAISDLSSQKAEIEARLLSETQLEGEIKSLKGRLSSVEMSLLTHQPKETGSIEKELQELRVSFQNYVEASQGYAKWQEETSKNPKPLPWDGDSSLANLRKNLESLKTQEIKTCPLSSSGFCKVQEDAIREKREWIQQEIQGLEKLFVSWSVQMGDWKLAKDRIDSEFKGMEYKSIVDSFDQNTTRKIHDLEIALEKARASESEKTRLEQEKLELEVALAEKTANRTRDSTLLSFKIRDINEKLEKSTIDLQSLDRKLQSNSLASASIDREINQLNEQLFKLSGFESSLTEAKADLSKVEENLAALGELKEAFGPNGIKAILVDLLIPKLEEDMNSVLSKLSDFRIQLETQKNSVTGNGAIEGLFVNVVDPQGRKMDYACYSGGEKLKISVAVAEAFATMQKCGFRLLDELFIGLDPQSVSGFAGVLDRIQDRFSQILCISHLKEIQDLFPEKIEIIKNNAISKIKYAPATP